MLTAKSVAFECSWFEEAQDFSKSSSLDWWQEHLDSAPSWNNFAKFSHPGFKEQNACFSRHHFLSKEIPHLAFSFDSEIWLEYLQSWIGSILDLVMNLKFEFASQLPLYLIWKQPTAQKYLTLLYQCGWSHLENISTDQKWSFSALTSFEE